MRVLQLLFALTASALFAGCPSAGPSPQPGQAALPPSQDRLWTSLEAAAPGVTGSMS